jgi:hydroxyquinol 1,2-dioxygenase
MRNINEDTITPAVLASFATCPDERLRTLIASLVQHLHSFVREVRLTEAEWFKAIQFLTGTGHITDDKRQEFILLSDTLGISMLVTALNSRKPQGCTESTVFGPFFVEGAPRYENGADIARGAGGEPCWVSGSVSDLAGNPIAGAVVDVWQADEAGCYDVQYPDLDEHRVRGRFVTLESGAFHFKSIVASSYPIPHDGPVGKMLAATGRHPWRPAHLHFMIVAKGFKRLITHVFRRDDRYLDSDAVFGVRSTLIADWRRHAPGRAPDGTESRVPFYSLDYKFVLDSA